MTAERYFNIPKPDAQLLNAGTGNPPERETRRAGATVAASTDKEEKSEL